ncbi:MAG: phosphoribosyltransferase [Desulfobulbaceae bacterium]|nr:phosphoribosyltransferase [Desulfobulbaceae bacterium]
MTDEFHCELISWNQIYRLARHLYQKIDKNGYKPDIIVAIARGGYIPARILCDFMGIYNLTSIRIVHYVAGAKKQKQARLDIPLCCDILDKKVLVVDDVSDTGDTFDVAIPYLKSLEPAEIKTAVLNHKKTASCQPDFYAEKVIKWRWLIYPWAVIEDISGFIAQMDTPPVTPDDAIRRLKKKYHCQVPKKIMEDVFSFIGTDKN